MKRSTKRITITEKYSRESYQDKYWTEWATRKAQALKCYVAGNGAIVHVSEPGKQCQCGNPSA